MKKLRENMKKNFDMLDKRWRALPLKKQRRYTLVLFLGYLILTIAIIIRIGCDVKTSKNGISVEPIENPIIKKQTP